MLNDIEICTIIPTHNRKELLKILLHQLQTQTNANFNFINKIVVVDDGSTDGTFDMLVNDFPEVHVVKGSGNWWWTKCMNEGIKRAIELNSDYVLTMNDDTVVKTDYIQKLLLAISKVQRNSIMGSVSFTISEPFKILNSGYLFKIKYLGIMNPYLPLFKEVNPEKIKEKILVTEFLPGRGMLIPKDILQSLNLFDEIFKQYHSDWDFCSRAKEKGYEVYISWDAHVFVNEKMTGTGTSFLREPFFKYLSHYFRATSRLYLPSNCIFNWRHKPKILWPINIVLFLLISLKNFFTKEKIN